MVLARPVQHRDVADALDQPGAGLVHDLGDHGVPRFAILRTDLDLDQFVLLQDRVQFSQEGWRKAFGADLEQGFQVVRVATQEA